MATRNILVIDDHALLRAGLRMVLANGFREVAVHEAPTLSAALALGVTPDIVLLDVELPGLNGVEGIALVRAHWREAPVVMLTSHAEAEVRDETLARGAAAFVSKAEPLENIVGVIDRVLRGRLSPAKPQAAGAPQLTPRQSEVLDLLCQGLSNKVIGQRLGLTENTVRWHVQAVLAFLNVSSRSEAAYEARRRGLVK